MSVSVYPPPPVPPYGYQVGLGDVGNVGCVDKFGYNSQISSGTPEDVWDGGGLYPFQAASYTAEGVSDNAADGVAGIGALTVEVQGLDENWAPQTQSFITDGVTPVIISGLWMRIFRSKVLTAGTNETNVGNITIQVSVGGDVQAVITEELGQTLMAVYTVPAGKQALLNPLFIDAGRNDDSLADLLVKPFGGAWNIKRRQAVYQAGKNIDLVACPIIVGEKSDIRMNASTIGSSVAVAAGFAGTIFDL